MTLCEALSKRYQFEKLISFRQSFDLPNYESDIDSLTYFINNGHRNNRFRKNFEPAMEIAKEIIDYYDRSVEPLGRELEG